jgi:hypothetical protein
MRIDKHTVLKSLVFFISCVFRYELTSQVNYPTDSSFIKTVSNIEKSQGTDFENATIDTVISNFQNYAVRNSNGQFGTPSRLLELNFQAKKLGFNMLTAPYQNDMISEDNVMYYKTKGPYASLTGIAGGKQEQLFKMLFSNTFKNNLNITVAFNRYSGIGFYKHQQSFTNNFYTSLNYTSKNNRVGYTGFFLFNKLKHQENGGISSDSLLIANLNINKALLPVNLNGAKREYRNSVVEFNPWVRLNKKEDSSTVFSHIIDYQFNYSGSFSKYVDTEIASENFYNVFYLDTVSTKDSSHWISIRNGLNYSLKINPINSILKFGYKNEINQVYQYLDSILSNNTVSAGFYTHHKSYSGFIKAEYIAKGSNQNDYLIEFGNRLIKNKSLSFLNSPLAFNLNASIEKRHPDFIFNSWVSNHYQWQHDFISTEKKQAQVILNTIDNRFSVGAIYQDVKNLIYFNEFAVPEQTPVSIQNISAFIQKDVLLFKHLGINAKYNYQSSSYQAIVSIPNHIVNGALYYQGNLFKRALQLQIGFNVQYFSEFYGMAYMPATNQFYVQTTTKVGDYPFVDFFLNARIKPVRIFVKYDHINQGLTGSNYALTPNYFQNDRVLKFGVNWLFFD